MANFFIAQTSLKQMAVICPWSVARGRENPNLEIRNPKQTQIPNDLNPKRFGI
jgi:hypothetical protein